MKYQGNWVPKFNEPLYQETLKNIVNNKDLFLTFKQNEIYRSVVGCDTMGEDACNILIKEIKEKHEQLLKDVKKFQENDKYGTPITFETKIGKFSPNTLRYMVILGEIEKHFGSFDNKNIIEIGSAYGGQCFIISRRHKFKSYTLIDVPGSIELSKKYLSLLNVENVIHEDTNNVTPKKSDLVISNFSLTEFDHSGFNFYFDNIIKGAGGFYLLTNIPETDIERREFFYKKLKSRFEITILEEPELRKTGSGIWIGERL